MASIPEMKDNDVVFSNSIEETLSQPHSGKSNIERNTTLSNSHAGSLNVASSSQIHSTAVSPALFTECNSPTYGDNCSTPSNCSQSTSSLLNHSRAALLRAARPHSDVEIAMTSDSLSGSSGSEGDLCTTQSSVMSPDLSTQSRNSPLDSSTTPSNHKQSTSLLRQSRVSSLRSELNCDMTGTSPSGSSSTDSDGNQHRSSVVSSMQNLSGSQGTDDLLFDVVSKTIFLFVRFSLPL